MCSRIPDSFRGLVDHLTSTTGYTNHSPVNQPQRADNAPPINQPIHTNKVPALPAYLAEFFAKLLEQNNVLQKPITVQASSNDADQSEQLLQDQLLKQLPQGQQLEQLPQGQQFEQLLQGRQLEQLLQGRQLEQLLQSRQLEQLLPGRQLETCSVDTSPVLNDKNGDLDLNVLISLMRNVTTGDPCAVTKSEEPPTTKDVTLLISADIESFEARLLARVTDIETRVLDRIERVELRLIESLDEISGRLHSLEVQVGAVGGSGLNYAEMNLGTLGVNCINVAKMNVAVKEDVCVTTNGTCHDECMGEDAM